MRKLSGSALVACLLIGASSPLAEAGSGTRRSNRDATVVVSPARQELQECDVTMLPGAPGLDAPVAQGRIRAMPDGNVWFGEGTSIARVTAAPPHPISKFAIDTPAGVTNDVAAGPDGNYWFTEIIGNKIGRISSDPGPPN